MRLLAVGVLAAGALLGSAAAFADNIEVVDFSFADPSARNLVASGSLNVDLTTSQALSGSGTINSSLFVASNGVTRLGNQSMSLVTSSNRGQNNVDSLGGFLLTDSDGSNLTADTSFSATALPTSIPMACCSRLELRWRMGTTQVSISGTTMAPSMGTFSGTGDRRAWDRSGTFPIRARLRSIRSLCRIRPGCCCQVSLDWARWCDGARSALSDRVPYSPSGRVRDGVIRLYHDCHLAAAGGLGDILLQQHDHAQSRMVVLELQ
jgi:hypothetical protein